MAKNINGNKNSKKKDNKNEIPVSPYAVPHIRRSKIQKMVIILFWSFIIITTSLLLLYSDGYNYDPESRTITVNGVITIDSSPEKAEVFINEKSAGFTPLTLSSVVPGDYQVSVSKKGFSTWEQNITVKKKEAISLKAVLFKNTDNLEKLSALPLEKLFFARNVDTVLFITKNPNNTFSLYSRPFKYNLWDISKDPIKIFTFDSIDNTEFYVSPEGNYTLIRTTNTLATEEKGSTQKNKIYLVHNQQNSSAIELSELYSITDIKNISWPSYGESKLLVFTDRQIFSYGISNRQVILLANISNASTTIFTTTDQKNLIYINTQDNIPYSVTLEGTNPTKLVSDINIEKYELKKITSLITDKVENYLILQTKNQVLLVLITKPIPEKQKAQVILKNYSPEKISLSKLTNDGKKFIFIDQNNNIRTADIIFTGINFLNPQIEVNETDFKLPEDRVKKFSQILWHPDNIHIFSLTSTVRENKTYYILEATNTLNGNITSLRQDINTNNFAISKDGDKVLFTLEENKKSYLYSLDLLDNEIIKL